VKLAVVVQRYGADISGGAELHARYIAERLARHAQVEVLTTRASDYITWRNELPAEERVNGIVVRRFPVARRRNVVEFGHRSRFVFEYPHTIAEELRWPTDFAAHHEAEFRALLARDHGLTEAILDERDRSIGSLACA
jgi:hypothetical protein